MSFSLVPDWNKMDLVCDICGTTKSVKYVVRDKYPITFYACNKCVMLRELAREHFKL